VIVDQNTRVIRKNDQKLEEKSQDAVLSEREEKMEI